MNPEESEDELRPEYDFDFSKAVRGKYYRQYIESTNVVVLEPDIAAVFHSSEAVNQALRTMLRFAEQTSSLTNRSSLVDRATASSLPDIPAPDNER